MCLAITCHLHFWQNDLDLLRDIAVTRRWNGYRNKRAQKVDPGEENSPAAPAGIREWVGRSGWVGGLSSFNVMPVFTTVLILILEYNVCCICVRACACV